MGIEIHIDKGAAEWTARPAGEMTIYAAAELKEPLLAAFEEAPALALDLSEVEELDTSGVQLLLLLAKEAARAGKPLRLAALSKACEETLTLADLLGAVAAPAAPGGS